MNRDTFPWLRWVPRAPRSYPVLHRPTLCCFAIGLAVLHGGCAEFRVDHNRREPAPIVARASGGVTELPSPEAVQPPLDSPADPPAKEHRIAINLDTVFRLAEEQNAQVSMARARVDEALAENDIAATSWLPSLNVGVAYLRHEGGISNENGTLTRSSFSALFAGLELNSKLDLREAVYQKVNAERQLWQQKGELRRITSETLLDAATTYIDLLAARTGEAIFRGQLTDLNDLLGRAEKLANPKSGEPGARIEPVRIRVQQKAYQHRLGQLREQARRASAKLTYLLGLDPGLTLVPVDEKLVPMDLIDASAPVNDLVAQALRTGPGIEEMEGLLSLIHQSIERSKGPSKYLPVFEMRMIEGGFGTGPGDSQTWDNRWDLGLQARWNLMELVTAHDRQRLIQAKTEQAHWAYEDLRGKLTAGVQEAREAVVGGKQQIQLAEEQIKEARLAHDLSEKRIQNFVAGSSYGEVLLSLESVALAQASYISSIRDFNGAQLRLLLLLGPANGQPADGNCESRCGKRQ